MQHFWKWINTFHKNYLNKLIATSSRIDTAPPMAKPTVKPRLKISSTKQKKLGETTKASGANKRAKKI